MPWYSRVGKALTGLFGARSPTPLTQPNGGDGVQAYGGWLPSDERNAALIGQQKWLTFANAHHTAIVATGLRYRSNLLASAKWHAEANPRGGRDAERAVDIVTQGLLTAQMERPWQLCVRKASMFQVNGFSLHEWSIKRRDDGMIVFADLGHRPPHTVQRWDKPSEQAPWQAVAQLTRAGNEYIIPRNRLWYCWDDTLTDMPDGVGLMRHVIELVRRLGVLEGLEGLAYESDVRGMPIGRAPIEELKKMAEAAVGVGADSSKIKGFIQDRTRNLTSQLENVIKSPDKLQWLMLDSATYRSADQNSVTAVQKWAFDLLRGDARGLMELDKVIGRLQLEIARVFGIEFVMMGAGSSGSKAMHADKTSMLAASLNGALSEMGASATRDLARPLVALNGLDPDTCTPTLVAESIDSQDVTTACQALLYLSQAGLQQNDEAIPVIRGWLGLPEAPEPDPAMMGMLGTGAGGPGGKPSGAPGEPNPDDGEVDVPVDDLEGEADAGKVAKFDPEQPRDDHGRFGSGRSGATASTTSAHSSDEATSKDRDVDRAFRHAAAGDHAKAKALFDRHGVSVPDNVRLLGAQHGFDYNAAPQRRTSENDAKRALAVGRFVARDPRRQLRAVDSTDTAGGRSARQFTPESQAALRGHFNDAYAKYGMTNRDAGLAAGHQIEVRDDGALAAAAALHYTQTGKVEFNFSTAANLDEHGRHDPTDLGRKFKDEDPEAQRLVTAYRIAAHEAAHGHGPNVDYVEHGIMLEEMTTEMAARKLAADAHGLSTWDMRAAGSYHGYVSPTVSALSDATGRSRQDAHDALARAAIDFKRGGTARMGISSKAALRKLGENALHHLGVHDESHANAVHNAMLAASEDP